MLLDTVWKSNTNLFLIYNLWKGYLKYLVIFHCQLSFCFRMYIFLYVLLIYSIYSYAAKLNVPKLLLPHYNDVAVNFTLEVDSGCFLWFIKFKLNKIWIYII